MNNKRQRLLTGETLCGRYEAVVRILLQEQHTAQESRQADCRPEPGASKENRRPLRSRYEEQRPGP